MSFSCPHRAQPRFLCRRTSVFSSKYFSQTGVRDELSSAEVKKTECLWSRSPNRKVFHLDCQLASEDNSTVLNRLSRLESVAELGLLDRTHLQR